ncbi:MAG: hypothetical protein LIO78_01140 [Clostridiales bacterium]|nr:hypothetical protein [Clostridiales bacterium]
MNTSTSHKDCDHDVRVLKFFDKAPNQQPYLCTMIYADFTTKELSIENYTDNFVKKAFGNKQNPTWEDFQQFLEDRCVPSHRAGIREYLETIGVFEYDPLAIIEKTSGRMAEDQQWLTVEAI